MIVKLFTSLFTVFQSYHSYWPSAYLRSVLKATRQLGCKVHLVNKKHFLIILLGINGKYDTRVLQ